MKRTLIKPDYNIFPCEFNEIIRNCNIYDSSCSADAKVFFIDKDEGFYLKRSAKGSLKKEADMNAYFNSLNLAPKVLQYLSLDENDWLLTARANGEDCTHPEYLTNPKRLCDTIAESLRMLHSLDITECPIQNKNDDYVSFAERIYLTNEYNPDYSPDYWNYESYEEAWKVVSENKHTLKCEVLLHGDYCLPNIMLDNWKLSAFIDLGNGGIGDRHIDLFWGVWTLNYNLKTDKYRDRFLDVYGRSDVNTDMFRVIAAFEVFA